MPPVDCKVEDWSSWTKCSATCGGGTKTRGRGIVQEIGGAVCPALEEKESCNTDQCPGYFFLLQRLFLVCSVDCEVDDWSTWSDCSATCGEGTKTRERGVVQGSENGGAECPVLEEKELCNTDQCPGYILFLWNNFLSVQLTVRLKIGPRGLTAVWPVEKEPRREEGELFERRRREELSVRLWRKKSLATLTNAKVFFLLMTQTNSKLTSIPTHL